jgi:hypothetical protein
VSLTYAERQALKLLIDQRRRALAFETEADSFVRRSVQARRGVSRDRLFRLRTRGGLSDEQIDRAVARLGVVADKNGILRIPADIEAARRAA